MENKKYQDEFEQFLQDEVKQHRMYPSDHIWKNIRTDLHGYKAWPALTFISLFIITALTISTLLNHHPQQLIVRTLPVKITRGPATLINLPLTATKSIPTPEADYFQQISPEKITAETFADLNLNENRTSQEQSPVTDKVIVNSRAVTVAVPVSENVKKSDKQTFLPLVSSDILPQNKFSQQNSIPADLITNETTEMAAPGTLASAEPDKKEMLLNTTEAAQAESHTNADGFLKDFHYIANTASHQRNSKFGFQLYVTPSTSYRRLSDEKVKEVIQPAAAAALSASQNSVMSVNYAAFSPDVNTVVRHRPAIGLELGFAVLYNMSERLKFKTGLQLNIRQYYIETFQSRTSDLSTLSLINYRGIETISFYSPYNNNTGYKQTQLENKVYQVSVPIGIQWEMLRGKHFGLNTEASVQPTFTLNNNTYLLSTDYKHYTDGSDFIRKWNINTSLGLTVTYKNGSSSWQIGPQLRYQHLPTFSNLYPIKEYLMDYGVRLGFTKQIK